MASAAVLVVERAWAAAAAAAVGTSHHIFRVSQDQMRGATQHQIYTPVGPADPRIW